MVQSVTSAPESPAEEQGARIRRYLITMGIRTVCFIGAVVAATQGAPWWAWGSLALAAIVLPYVAVVMANAVRPRQSGTASRVDPAAQPPHEIERPGDF